MTAHLTATAALAVCDHDDAEAYAELGCIPPGGDDDE